ncbi:hypothetical protein [Lysobacter capsici]|uniref:hypothetical protein n=1 Tax=Lysobacter capsici TaxID=435897 RepID=UPI001BFFE1A2|nr:hypothetical protein [Lysobacter capsici]QWF15594.1 hypothetical protein KME82_17635 [Lysobacter capsici]
MRLESWMLCGCVAMLSACASAPPHGATRSDAHTGAVGVRSIDKLLTAPERMQLADNETFQMPLAERDNAAPTYPDELLAQRLAPQTVCLNVAIGADGRVSGSRPVGVEEGCPASTAAAPQFVEAARAAVLQWRFDPAFRCVYPGARPQEEGCVTGREEAVAVSLAFSFVFEQKQGKGTVRVGG